MKPTQASAVATNATTMASAPIPAAIVADAIDSIKKAIDALTPFGTSLSPAEIRRLAKMSDKTVAFVKKGAEFCNAQPVYLPSYFSLTDWRIGIDNYNLLSPVILLASQLMSLISDTRMANGNNAYLPALGYYDAVNKAAKNNVPGAKDISKDLSARFAKKKKKVVPVTESISIMEGIKAA